MAIKPKEKPASAEKLLKPKALKAGDRVGLVCPGSRPQSPSVVERCLRIVEEMGLTPVLGSHVLNVHGCMAGTDDERLFDLSQFLEDDSIAGIFCLTGGFGSMHLLPKLDFEAITRHPKVILGSDDNTHLLLALNKCSGLVTFHGPNLDRLSSGYAFDRLKDAVMSKTRLKPISAADLAGVEIGDGHPHTPVPGTADGAVLGGNLSCLVSLMGTPYEPDLEGSILFLEDTNERIDILDRWFTTLYVSGKLARTSAVALGIFDNCNSKDSHNLLSLEDLFGDRLKRMKRTSCFGLPIGQSGRAATIPVGVKARLDASRGVLEIAESHLS